MLEETAAAAAHAQSGVHKEATAASLLRLIETGAAASLLRLKETAAAASLLRLIDATAAFLFKFFKRIFSNCKIPLKNFQNVFEYVTKSIRVYYRKK